MNTLIYDCEIRIDTPIVGKAQVVRLDTGEIVETRDMTEAEKQVELALVVEMPTEEKPKMEAGKK